MTLKNYLILPILAIAISGCSLLGSKQVEIVSKPIQIDIMQPDLPRTVELTAPQWYVVSEARITNPCKKIEDKRPKTCDLSERLCVTSATCSAAAPPLSTSVKSRPTERLSPLLAFSTSEITVESSIATGGHCLTNTFGYIFSGCART